MTHSSFGTVHEQNLIKLNLNKFMNRTWTSWIWTDLEQVDEQNLNKLNVNNIMLKFFSNSVLELEQVHEQFMNSSSCSWTILLNKKTTKSFWTSTVHKQVREHLNQEFVQIVHEQEFDLKTLDFMVPVTHLKFCKCDLMRWYISNITITFPFLRISQSRRISNLRRKFLWNSYVPDLTRCTWTSGLKLVRTWTCES